MVLLPVLEILWLVCHVQVKMPFKIDILFLGFHLPPLLSFTTFPLSNVQTFSHKSLASYAITLYCVYVEYV